MQAVDLAGVGKKRKVKVLLIRSQEDAAVLEAMLEDAWVIAHSASGSDQFLVVVVKS